MLSLLVSILVTATVRVVILFLCHVFSCFKELGVLLLVYQQSIGVLRKSRGRKAEERIERSSQILQIRTFILYVTQPKGEYWDSNPDTSIPQIDVLAY